MSLMNNDMKLDKEFSLDVTEEEAMEYMATFLQEHPRRLHEAVAANPMSATRCFHWTVKLVIRTLFNCDDKPGASPDSVPAHAAPGVFGHVRAYLGVVEPQMRKALHIHMLVQLVGFGHPDDIFGSDSLPSVFRRLWYFIASICFRSTEAFADYLGVDAAMDALRQEPLLPLTKKQQGMIGTSRTKESQQAQLKARGSNVLPANQAFNAPISYMVSPMHADSSVSANTWAQECVKSVAANTRKTGNHVCRPDVCHKGRIGAKGFCRMYFWHWSRSVNEKKDVIAKRAHGLLLQSRWDGCGPPPVLQGPPHHGLPALEITHPFHFKMSPAMLLGPKCNHDLGVLLRLPACSQGHAPTFVDREAAISAMLEAMGDREYYCASYWAELTKQECFWSQNGRRRRQ